MQGPCLYMKKKITCPFGQVVRCLSEMLLRYELLSLVLIFCKRMSYDGALGIGVQKVTSNGNVATLISVFLYNVFS